MSKLSLRAVKQRSSGFIILSQQKSELESGINSRSSSMQQPTQAFFDRIAVTHNFLKFIG